MDKSANPQPPPTPKVATASIAAAAAYGDTGADPAPPSTAKRLRSVLFEDDPDDPNKRRSVFAPTDTTKQASTPAS
jgi:hypothetical protein